MTFFIKLEKQQPTGHAILEENFRQLFPEFSYPTLFTPEMVEPLGFGIYDFSSQPSIEKYKKVIEVAPVRNTSGVWIQTWQVVDKNEEERLQEDQEKAEMVRYERNIKLMQSDWTQVKDAPVDQDAWGVYRQALRDITLQPGFPWEINWPVAP